MTDHRDNDDTTAESAPLLDLTAMAEGLVALGIRCALWEDISLRIGRVCLYAHGGVTVEGGAAGAHHLCRLLDLLRAGTLPDPEGPPLPAADVASGTPVPRPPRRAGPRELRGRAAQAAVEAFIAACEAEMVEVQRLRPGCWLVGGRVLYHPTSGRVRRIGSATHYARGLPALRQALVREGVLDVPVPAAAE